MILCSCALEAQVMKKQKKLKQQKVSPYAWGKFLKKQKGREEKCKKS